MQNNWGKFIIIVVVVIIIIFKSILPVTWNQIMGNCNFMITEYFFHLKSELNH